MSKTQEHSYGFTYFWVEYLVAIDFLLNNFIAYDVMYKHVIGKTHANAHKIYGTKIRRKIDVQSFLPCR